MIRGQKINENKQGWEDLSSVSPKFSEFMGIDFKNKYQDEIKFDNQLSFLYQ